MFKFMNISWQATLYYSDFPIMKARSKNLGKAAYVIQCSE